MSEYLEKNNFFHSSDRHDPTQRYVKSAAKSKQDTSEIWTEAQEEKSGEQRAQDRSYRSQEIAREKSQERQEKRTDRSNGKTPPRASREVAEINLVETDLTRERSRECPSSIFMVFGFF